MFMLLHAFPPDPGMVQQKGGVTLDVSLVASGSESWIDEKLLVILARSECLTQANSGP